MNFIIKNSMDEIAQEIADKILSLVRSKPNAILGLATGSSPLLSYRALIAQAKDDHVSFGQVQTFNLDEYLDLKDPSQSYYTFMNNALFSSLDIPSKNIHFPAFSNYKRYDAMIRQAGGIDLQILGIGQNGHIAFNEPGTPFKSRTHIVTLTEKTRSDNARFFKTPEEVPTQAVSMGLQTILEARSIICIVEGNNKLAAMKKLFSETVDAAFPASVLNCHPNVTVYITDPLFRKAMTLN